jgi:hypothetical protein
MAQRMSQTLSMKPSEYLARNVRVTPFHFEPVASYFERYPELASSFCYSSDYPHVEGGKHQRAHFVDQLRPLGDDIVEMFLRTNGEWLLPAVK